VLEQDTFVDAFGVATAVVSVGFAAWMRRWGVGAAESILPRKWDANGTSVPSWALPDEHVAAWAGPVCSSLTSTTTIHNESVDVDTLAARDH